MTWRTHLGTLADRVGLDSKAVTQGADRLVNEAQKLAKSAEKAATAAVEQGLPVAKKLAATAVEQGVPVAKRVVAQLQTAASAAGAAADELVTRVKANAPSPTVLTTVPTKKAPRAAAKPPAAKPVVEPSVAEAPVVETPVSVRAKDASPFDLTGLSITIDDARELARAPKSLDQELAEPIDAATAKGLRDYVAATPSTIFAARRRIANNVAELTQRLGKAPVDPWRSVEQARTRLAAFDKQSGTDYAASSWASMVRGWSREEIPSSAHEALDAVTQLVRQAGASPRGRSHAADVCEAVLTVAHVEGWPTRLFPDGADLDSFFGVVKRAAASPDLKEPVARKLFGVAGAMMASPVAAVEREARAMNPLGLRAEMALRAVDILDSVGKTSHDGLRDAALKAAGSQEAQPDAAELEELTRVPRWFLSSRLDGISSAQAEELVAFVAGSKGDLRERELRLQSFVRTPRIRAEIAAHVGMDVRDSVLADAAAPLTNVKRALALLAAQDEADGTRYAIEAVKGLLGAGPRGVAARELVAEARSVFASRGTVDDKRFLLEQVHALVDKSAWPSLLTQNGVAQTVALIEDVTPLAASDNAFANQLFIIGYKLASTALPDGDVSDDAGRSTVAAAIAKAGTTLGRENDAAMFGFLERQLRGETP